MKRRSLKAKFLDLFSDEDVPGEPLYDPVHLGGTLLTVLAAVGVLYWLLWTLLVFEGGLFSKFAPAAEVLFTSKTLKDVGYLGSPYAMGPFEGWIGNVGALLLTGVLVFAAGKLYREAARGRSPIAQSPKRLSAEGAARKKRPE